MTANLSFKTFLIAAALGLTACGGSGGDDGSVDMTVTRTGDKAVASVDGTFIYESDLNREAETKGFIEPGETFAPAHPQYQTLLGQLIDQRLLSRMASADGLDRDAVVRRRIATARERLLGNVALEDFIERTVTEGAAQKFYQEQITLRQRGDEVRAAHILVPTLDEANAVKQKLASGADFAALAEELSTDRGSAAQGGDLGYFQAEAMVAPFSKRAFATEVGTTSEPVQTQFGWHVIKVQDRRKTPVPSYDKMRDEVRQFLTYREVEKLITELRDGSTIEYLADNNPKAAADDADQDMDDEATPEDEGQEDQAEPDQSESADN
ncbi:peptidylprolyl isomerase [Robiginitomaculum antarcticum]|uniref:peptidylprolyl isomerase n=1 Tax=Robiginitomaculum antarcticum TaxID=437507 RepID=UPI000377BC33|nr:peptidylprolyl isomerase [Robiginitomaculum antarcticum]